MTIYVLLLQIDLLKTGYLVKFSIFSTSASWDIYITISNNLNWLSLFRFCFIIFISLKKNTWKLYSYILKLSWKRNGRIYELRYWYFFCCYCDITAIQKIFATFNDLKVMFFLLIALLRYSTFYIIFKSRIFLNSL